jgi:predicted nucleic acid-binding protein
MMNVILDTGPWVALIDRSEARHPDCVEWFKGFSGNIYSTEAVLTEILYLLNFSIIAQGAAMDFVLKSVVEIIPSNIQSLRKTKNLMKKYADLPMDYADATLVCLAVDTGIQNIATFDKKDFTIYTLPARKKFNLVLDS